MNKYAIRPGGLGGNVPKNGGHPPLRTFKEMAEEFGLTQPQLSAEVARSPAPVPAKKLTYRSNATGQHNTWYDPSEMRAWWKAHNEATQ